MSHLKIGPPQYNGCLKRALTTQVIGALRRRLAGASACARIFEQLRNFGELRSIRELQRRAAVFVRRIRIGAVSQQQPYDLDLPFRCCDQERRAAQAIAILGGGMLIQEHRRACEVSCSYRSHQGSL
jgi:hypothetical protein